MSALKRRAHNTRTPGLYKVAPSRIFKEGGWEVRYRDNTGGTRRKTFKKKQDALDFQAKMRTDKNRGEFVDPRLARTPFGVLAERWYNTTVSLTPSTRAGYRVALDAHLLPEFGERPISSIKSSEVEAFLGSNGWAVATQRNLLRIISPIMAMAVRDDMIKTNPCERGRIKLAPKPKRKMLKLTAKQVEELAEEITPRFSLLVRFVAYTGMRAGEIAALKVRHLDLDLHGRVHVEESATEVGKTIPTGPAEERKGTHRVPADVPR